MTTELIGLESTLLKAFPNKNRDDALQFVQRFQPHSMIHRQNLDMHKECMKIIAKKYVEILKKDYKIPPFTNISLEELLNMIEVHDDPEIITSDIPTHIKDLRGNYIREFQDRMEYLAMIGLAEKYSKELDMSKEEYISYMTRAKEKNKDDHCAQVCSLIDRLSAIYLEVTHEIISGNFSLFVEGVDRRYLKKVSEMKQKMPSLKTFLNSDNPLNFTSEYNLMHMQKKINWIYLRSQNGDNSYLFDTENKKLYTPSAIPGYEFFRQALLEHDENFAKAILAEKRESEPIK